MGSVPTNNCIDCGIDITNAPRRPGTRGRKYGNRCRECHCTERSNKRDSLLRECIVYLGDKCEDCKQTFPDCVYDFHHLRDKSYNIAVNLRPAHTLDKHKEELDKCVLLCSNCHRIRHKKRTPEGPCES